MTTLRALCEMLDSGKITVADAAQSLGITERRMKQRMTVWGNRLGLLADTLDLIASDKITRSEAAERLGVGERNINALMSNWGVERPTPLRVVRSAAREVTLEVRKKAALDFMRGTTGLEDAAEAAGVSERQLRRWVSDLLMKHFEMTWKELVPLSLQRRQRLAQEIEKAEGIELAKKRVIESITRGDKSIEQEALERLADRKIRKFPNVQ